MPISTDCPVCGTRESTEILNLENSLYFPRRIARCAGCGLLFVNPRPTDAELAELYNRELGDLGRVEWDRKKKEYRRVTTEDALAAPAGGNTPQKTRAAYRAAYLEKLTPPPATVLDVGCKSGDFLLAAKARGYTGHGVELSRPYAEQAARNTGFHVFTGPLEEFSRADPDARFDTVTLWDVIEHLPNPASTLETAGSLQEPGGLLALSTPNLGSYKHLLYRDKWTGFREGPEHLLFFSPHTLCRLVEKCGYRPVRVATYQIPPFFLKWLNVFRLGNSLEVVARKM